MFDSIIEADPESMGFINGGSTARFHALARAEASGEGAEVIISIFHGQPRTFPYSVKMMERHPLSSQSFSPVDDRPWLSVVAEDEGGRLGRPRVFLAGGRQGVNYKRKIWHSPLMSIGMASDFIVVDRAGRGGNLEEFFYDEPFTIPVFF